jgi:hypothetical protein
MAAMRRSTNLCGATKSTRPSAGMEADRGRQGAATRSGREAADGRGDTLGCGARRAVTIGALTRPRQGPPVGVRTGLERLGVL